MKDAIIRQSIQSLQSEGLRFSVDTLADNLKISKKTIYKYFPTKEALAMAVYDTYYQSAEEQAALLAQQNSPSVVSALLRLYGRAKWMTRKEIFNKYKLNGVLSAYAAEKQNRLWKILAGVFVQPPDDETEAVLRLMIDGVFEKLFEQHADPNAVVERLVKLL